MVRQVALRHQGLKSVKNLVTGQKGMRCWWPIYYIEKNINITILLPKSLICRNNKVTNITLSPTSLSPSVGV